MSQTPLQGILVDGRYELAEPLDRSGAGEVWRARDSSLGVAVDVQLLTALGPAEAADQATARARFAQVAAQLAGLDSPHLAAVVGHGTTELAGRPGVGYLTLAPLRGRPLGQVLREQGSIGWRRALAWAEQICTALAAAHAAGLAHGGLQPAGVLVDDGDGSEHGTVTVLDTGLAEFTSTGLPPAGADARSAGTVPYLAPERGPGAPAGARTDVYAVGCLLYELLVGRPPYAGTVAEVREQHRESLPLRPSRAVRAVPEAVDDVVFTLMAREPADRPAHAGQAAAAVAAVRAALRPPGLRAGAAQPPPAVAAEPREGPGDGPREVEPAEVMPEPADAALTAPPAREAQAPPAGLGRGRRVLAVAGAVVVAAGAVLGYLALTAYDEAEVLGSVQRAAQDLNGGELDGEGLAPEEAAEQALDDHSGWLRLRTEVSSTLSSGPEAGAVAVETTNSFGQHPVCLRVATEVPGPAFTARYRPGHC